MEIGSSAKRLKLKRVATFVIRVSRMQWLMDVGHKVDEVLQGLQSLFVTGRGPENPGLPLDGTNNALPAGAVPRLVIPA